MRQEGVLRCRSCILRSEGASRSTYLQNVPPMGSTSPTRTKGPKREKRGLIENMLPRARKLDGIRRDMSNGRSEKRIARTVSLKVSVPPEPKLGERTSTENVSAHGARVLVEQRQIGRASCREGEKMEGVSGMERGSR